MLYGKQQVADQSDEVKVHVVHHANPLDYQVSPEEWNCQDFF